MKKFFLNQQWPLLGLALTIFTNAALAAADQTKADNATALNAGGSWVSGTAPDSTHWAIWDSTVATAVNCSNALGGNVTWGGIQIKNPSAPVNIPTGSTLTLNGVGGVGIDMSSATVNLTLGSGVTPANSQLFSVASGRTLSVNGISIASNIALTFTNGGNVVITGTIFGGSGTNIVMSGTGALTIAVASYCKNTVLNSGTLNLNQAFSINGNANQTFIVNGGTIDNTSGGAIGLTANSPTNIWNGDFTYVGTGSLNLGGGAVTLGGNRQVTCNANTLTVGGVISDGSSGYSLTKAGGVTAARPRSNEAVLAHGHLSRSVSDEVLTPVSALNHPPT